MYYTTSALVVKKEEYVTKGACNISPYVGNGIIKTWFREEIRCESYISEGSLRVLLKKSSNYLRCKLLIRTDGHVYKIIILKSTIVTPAGILKVLLSHCNNA